MPPTLGDLQVPLAIICLAALAMGVAGSAKAVMSTRTWDETTVHDPWMETASFSFIPLASADAGGGTPRADADGPGQLIALAPQVDVAFTWAISDERAPRVVVGATLLLVDAARPDAPRRELDRRYLDAKNGEPIKLMATLDVEALGREAEERGGGGGGGRWNVVATVQFASSALEEAAHTSNFSVPLRVDPPLYVFGPRASWDQTRAHGTVETTSHHERGGLKALAEAPWDVCLALGGIAGLAYLGAPRRRNA